MENLIPIAVALTMVISALNLFILGGIFKRIERIEDFFFKNGERIFERRKG